MINKNGDGKMAGRYRLDELNTAAARIFEAAGFRKDYAERVADNLVTAEARGVYSHGLVHLTDYVELFRLGKIQNNDFEVVRDFAATALIDAHHAPGAPSGEAAMDLAIEKAKQFGVGIVSVKNGTHFGMAYYYARRALKENMIGLAFTNAGDMVAPFGGKTKQIGTNPICITSPTEDGGEITFDAATSVQAFNKLYHASVEKKPIPLGWAIDPDGNDTTDPNLGMAGALLPFGGYKGYGLGFMVNLLTGILSGSSLVRHEDGTISEDIHNCGFNFCAIDISKFNDLKDYFDGQKLFADRITSSARKDGVDKIYLPGEIEVDKYYKALKEGILLGDGVEGNLLRLQEEFGLENRLTKI